MIEVSATWSMGLVTRSTWWSLQGLVKLVPEQNPLAAERVTGRQRVAQFFVVNVSAEKVRGQFLDSDQLRVIGGQRGVVVLQLPQPPAFSVGRQRVPAEAGQLFGAEGAVGLWHHPRGRALENRQFPSGIGDFGDNLHTAGPRADHRHLLAGQVDRRVPLRGVHDLAGEVAEPGDVGIPD